MIKVSDMSLKYSRSKIKTLDKINFNVSEGEIIGFLGPSGSGKSTLQKVLSGVLRNYTGNVKVFGIEVKNRTSSFYENIGVDFEFPNFYSKFTALENLKYFSSLYDKKTEDPIVLMERLGLKNEAHKKVSSYSKGMKMRLGFIRCLLHNPKLLFLDEPTSGLDPSNARILKDIILEQKEIGRTIILTTHNMHDAVELCDRVAFIVDGKIKVMDTPKDLQIGKSDIKVQYTYILNKKEIEESCLISELNENSAFTSALKNGTIISIYSKEKTLEDIFIELTGRCLK